MEIGVGSAISKTYGFISVARYSPKGGEGGPQAFIKNVFPKGIYFDQRATILSTIFSLTLCDIEVALN